MNSGNVQLDADFLLQGLFVSQALLNKRLQHVVFRNSLGLKALADNCARVSGSESVNF